MRSRLGRGGKGCLCRGWLRCLRGRPAAAAVVVVVAAVVMAVAAVVAVAEEPVAVVLVLGNLVSLDPQIHHPVLL
jgi:hypothetical protein